MSRMPIVVLASGSGSNLQALMDAAAAQTLPVSVAAVVSDRDGAYALERAARAGIPAHVVRRRDYRDGDAFCEALRRCIDAHRPGLVVLAGFMRILNGAFVGHYRRRLINLHPSLLPKYRGLDTHRRVLEHGERWHGASVHFVSEELDAGPVIIQGRIEVEPGDSPERLQQKVHGVEHRILPAAVRWFAEGRLTITGDRVLLDGRTSPEQGLSGEGDTLNP